MRDNITRYYNLQVVTGDPRAAKHKDPTHAWFDLVIAPILDAHYDSSQYDEHHRNAEKTSELLSGHAVVSYHSERGDELDTVMDASIQTAITEFARPYARMYVMQIARFLACLLSELGYAAYSSPLTVNTVPHLSDFFATFNNSDSSLKEREKWSIYPSR